MHEVIEAFVFLGMGCPQKSVIFSIAKLLILIDKDLSLDFQPIDTAVMPFVIGEERIERG